MIDLELFVDHQWTLTGIDGDPVVTDRPPIVVFAADGSLSGFAGVNRLMGRWHFDDDVLHLDGPATTMMAGPPEAMELEHRFLRTLGTGGPVVFDDGDMLVHTGGQGLRFTTMSRVTGTVAYRERIAMPPDAVITVQLLDVSRMDVAADVVATTTIAHPGNVPVAFTLEYRPAAIVESHSYSVAARIHVDGELWWTSTTHNAVLTRESPDVIDVLVKRVGQDGQR